MDGRKAAAWFIIVIMVLSIAGYIGGSIFAPSTASVTQTFAGYTFARENNMWTVTLSGQKYGFLYLPQEVQSFILPVSVASWKSAGKVYLITEAKMNETIALSASSISLLGAVLSSNGVRLQEGCISEKDCTKDVPLVSCQQPSIIVRDGAQNTTETMLLSDRQCLIVGTSSASEFEKVTERIIYEFLGVLS